MSAIKNKNTKPELTLRKELHKIGYRYRLNVNTLPGSPDLVLTKYKAVVFVNGSFWHLHGCQLTKLPSTRKEWWSKKLTRNKERDLKCITELISGGWRVLIVWGCAFKGKSRLPLEQVVYQVKNWLEGEDTSLNHGFYEVQGSS